MGDRVDIVDWVRGESYKDLLEAIGFFGLLLGIPTGGLGLFIVFPVGLLLLALKICVEMYDGAQDRRAKAQLNISYANNWGLLKDKIISLSSDQYFEKIEFVLNEIDLSQKPPKEGPIENWKYLNQRLEIAVIVYLAILQFIQVNDLGPRKDKLEAFCVIGLMKIDDFAYVFKIFERTTDQWIKGTLAETLALTAHAAPTRLLLIFRNYSGKIGSRVAKNIKVCENRIRECITPAKYRRNKCRIG